MRVLAVCLSLSALCYAEPASNSEVSANRETAPQGDVASAQGASYGASYPQGAAYPRQSGSQGVGYAAQDSDKPGAFAPQFDRSGSPLDYLLAPPAVGAGPGLARYEAMPGMANPKAKLPEQSRPSPNRQPPALKNSDETQIIGLRTGDVFGLVTLSADQNVNNETVIIYKDGTLGINEPNSPGYLFEATHMSEYNLLIAPEPLQTVKLNNKGVLFLNDSLYNPAPIFSSHQWTLHMADGHGVVCPSWNSVLVYVGDHETPPCQDAVNVDLHIVPITFGGSS